MARRCFRSSILLAFLPEISTEILPSSEPTTRISPDRTKRRRGTPEGSGASKWGSPTLVVTGLELDWEPSPAASTDAAAPRERTNERSMGGRCTRMDTPRFLEEGYGSGGSNVPFRPSELWLEGLAEAGARLRGDFGERS